MPEKKKARNILFITSTRIGDAILSTGILNHLITENKGAKVTVVCGEVAEPLFAVVPNLEKVIVMRKQKFSLHWFKLWRKIVFRKWDIVVDLRRSLISYLILSKKRYTLAKSKEKKHRVEEIAGVIGMKDVPPNPFIWLAKDHRYAAEKRMYNVKNVLALAPASNWKAKTWDIENFIAIANKITGKGGFLEDAYVAVFAAESERSSIKPLLKAIPSNRLIDCAGGASLLTVCACLEKCDFFIGNDSGLMHMAAATGVLTLGLFGPTDERLYAPWGDRAAIVRTKTPFAEIFPENFNHRTSGSLMDSLTVEMVEDKAWELWNKYHKKPVRSFS
ncbi:MAG: glycosyltransferase family 9 protein [Alphaproteobacteria bacterium]